MKLIKPQFEIIEQPSGLDGIYKMIEIAGRTCYKSEDKITEDSAKRFVERMINAGHGAMLEHGTVYLKFPMLANDKHLYHKAMIYDKNPYSEVRIAYEDNGQPIHINGYYITTNLRVLVENEWMDDLQYICEPTKYHEKRVTVKFTCDRVTGESFLRHRVIDEDHPTLEYLTREMEPDINSYARESTRYCNYSKNKFNNELNIIQPCWTYDDDLKIDYRTMADICDEFLGNLDLEKSPIDYWLAANAFSEFCYMKLIEKGWKAQQARIILPYDIKSPLVMTGFISDWKHFFKLRCDTAAHPQARELAIPLQEEFIKRNILMYE